MSMTKQLKQSACPRCAQDVVAHMRHMGPSLRLLYVWINTHKRFICFLVVLQATTLLLVTLVHRPGRVHSAIRVSIRSRQRFSSRSGAGHPGKRSCSHSNDRERERERRRRWEDMEAFVPTCQVSVVRFYPSWQLLLLSPTLSTNLRALDCSRHHRTWDPSQIDLQNER